jgi:hypothetical protein
VSGLPQKAAAFFLTCAQVTLERGLLRPRQRPAVGRLGVAVIINRRFPLPARRMRVAACGIDETEKIAAFNRRRIAERGPL